MKTLSHIRTKAKITPSSCLSWILFNLSVTALYFIVSFTNAHAGQVTLAWDKSTESDVVGYKIYYGSASRNYTQSINITSPNVTTWTISNLVDGQTYYFAATAYNTQLLESGYSAEIFTTINPVTTSVPTTNTTSVSTTTTTSCPNYDTIRSLVRNFYLSILDREPDAPGWDFGTNVICDVQNLGIYIGDGFGAMARNYFFSPEYTAKNKTDEQFLTDLYETFCQRPPDPDGLNFWLTQLQCSSRSTILSWFRASTEFKTFMIGEFGADTSRPEKNLLNDLYRGFTHALPDDVGFAFNLPPLQQAQCVSTDPAVKKAAIKAAMYQLALQFSHQSGYAPTNADFLADAYDGILARGLDCPGFAFWLGQLNSGYNRDDLLHTFVYGTEFDPRAAAAANASCVLP